jgi:hypothetical protein
MRPARLLDPTDRPLRIQTMRRRRRGIPWGPVWYYVERYEPHGVLQMGWRKVSESRRTRAEAEADLQRMTVRAASE